MVDGQHRLLGVRARGDVPHLPCIISPAVDVATEAAMFTALNRRRKALSRFDIWRAAVAAGEPEAIEAKQLIEGSGLSVPKSTNTAIWKAGDFGGIAAVVRSIKQHGPRPVGMALEALAEAFGGEPITSGASLVHALVPIYVRLPNGFDPDAFIEALGSRMQDEWVEEARGHARSQMRDARQVLTENLLSAYGREVRR